jgi:glycosyltransferase involved in cell wall biosynthesis
MTDKIHIAIIADCLDNQNAGIHVYTRNMIDALEKNNHFMISCIRLKSNPDLPCANEIVVPPTFSFLQKDPIRLFITIPLKLRKLKPDFVIEPTHFGPFNLPKKMKRITIIHDLTPISHPQYHIWFSQFLQRVFLKRILKKAALVITNSNQTLNDLNHYYPFTKEKAVRIYPGVDPYFANSKTERMENKEDFFLSVGTIEPRKNYLTLLKAYQQLRENHRHLKNKLLICGGNGWKNKSFYRELNKHPFKSDIEVKGFVTKAELKELYSRCVAFIYPSHYEGFGFPVLEALHCGAKCIVSNSSSLTEVGKDAVSYFNPNSSVELAMLMSQIVKENNKLMNQFEPPVEFSWDHFTLRLEQTLFNYI